ncbi:MAG: PEGA domain-containing protein [Myxococcales bacterium]|nr:PEGA domain-containing protein [Myxococcales bacterium]
MTRPPSAPLRVLLLAAWGVLPAVGYAAPPSPEARARPEVRVEAEIRGALKKGDLEAAAEKVQKARDADPSSAALALLAAQIKTKQEEPAGAMRAYQDYLRLAGASAPTKERAEAVMKIQDLSVEVGSIVVRAKAKGARVLVDGTFVGVTPLPEPVPVMPGKHVLALEGSSAKATVSVKEEQSVTVELEGAAPASVATAGPATAPTTASSKKGAKEAPAKEPAKEAAKETPQETPLDRRPIWKELDPFAPEKPEKAEGPAAAAAAAPKGSARARRWRWLAKACRLRGGRRAGRRLGGDRRLGVGGDLRFRVQEGHARHDTRRARERARQGDAPRGRVGGSRRGRHLRRDHHAPLGSR